MANENQTPGRVYRGLRISGVSAPGIPELKGLSRQGVPEQTDITTEKFTQQNEDVQRGYQSALDAIRARGAARTAELEAQGRTPRESGLAGLAEAAFAAFETINKQDAAKKEAERKAALELGEQESYSLLQTSLLELENGMINSADTDGINTVEADSLRIIEDARKRGLPPTVIQGLERLRYETLQSARQRTNTRIFESQRELRTSTMNAKKADVNLAILGVTSALELAPDAASASTLIDQAFTIIGQQTQGMDINSRLEITAAALTTVTESANLSFDTMAEIARRQEGIEKLQAALPDLRANNPDPDSFRLAVEAFTAPYGITDLAGGMNPQDVIDQRNRTNQQNIWAYDEALLRRQQQQFAQEYPDFNSNMAQVQAFDMFAGNNIQEVSRIRALGDRALPNERQALQIYDMYVEMREQDQADLAELAKVNQEVATVIRQRDPNSLGNTRAQWDAIEQQWQRMPVSEILNTPQAAGSIGGVGSFAGTVQRFLGGRIQNVDGQEVLYVTPGVSAEEVAASVARRQLLENQIQGRRSNAAQQGLDLQNPTNTQYIEPIRAEYEAGLRNLEQIRTTQGSLLPNFETGGVSAPATPPVQPLARVNGNVTPFPATAQVRISSGYGPRVHPITGEHRAHHGIDLVGTGEGGDNVLSVQGGRVIRASQWGTYGGTVLVQTPDGRVEQFSHLREFNVREGQTIPPGFRVGLMGGGDNDPMAGSSTGRHVHFQVWKPNPSYGSPTRDTLPPLDYLASIQYNQRTPPGVGLPPAQGNGVGGSSPLTDDRTSTGNYQVPILPGMPPHLYDPTTRQTITTGQVFTPGNPRRTAQAPINRSAYPARSNPTHNYGYSVIARDPEFAREIANLANHLNIPGQWLADVMAYEVGADFSPRRAGGDANRYHGLIQISEANLRNMGLSVYDLRNMTRADYLRRVARPYFEEFRGRINTIEDLYASILGGSRLFRKSPQERGGIGDSNNSFSNHVRRIGHHVGRRYRTSYDGHLTSSLPVHTHVSPGCPICTNQSENNGFITPHQAVAIG